MFAPIDAVRKAQVQDGAGPEGVHFYACVCEGEKKGEDDGEEQRVDMHGWCSSANGFLDGNESVQISPYWLAPQNEDFKETKLEHIQCLRTSF